MQHLIPQSILIHSITHISVTAQSETPLRHLKGHSYKKRVEDKWKQLIIRMKL